MARQGKRKKKRSRETPMRGYIIDEQIGFVLRQVIQRHAAIFSATMNGHLTSPQWATLSKLLEVGPSTQNLLGRMVSMDGPTTKGVISRLVREGLAKRVGDPHDARRLVIALTPEGRRRTRKAIDAAIMVTERTLAPLSTDERAKLLELLKPLR
jgi:DNA-binding MarR family transcriptional regulator